MLLGAVACVVRDAPRVLTAATASVGVASLMLMTACYTYDVKAPTDLSAGQNIEVTVNNIGRVALAADLGEDVTKVGGDVVTVTDSALRMRVDRVEFLNGTASGYPGSEINVPRNAIASVSTKQFSRSKTTAVAVGLVAALIAAIGAVGLAGIGGSSPDSKPCANNCGSTQ